MGSKRGVTMEWRKFEHKYFHYAIPLFFLLTIGQVYFIYSTIEGQRFFIVISIVLAIFQISLIFFSQFYCGDLYQRTESHDVYEYLDKLKEDRLIIKKIHTPNLSLYPFPRDIHVFQYKDSRIIIGYDSMSKHRKLPTIIIPKQLLSDHKIQDYLVDPFKKGFKQ